MFDVQTGSGCAARDSQASCSVQRGNPCGELPNCTGGFSKDESHSIYDRVPESGTFIAFQNGLDSLESTTREGNRDHFVPSYSNKWADFQQR